MNCKRSTGFVHDFNFPTPSQCKDESDDIPVAQLTRRALFTALMPSLVSGYERPVAVGECLAQLRQKEDEGTLGRALWHLGLCRAKTFVTDWPGQASCLASASSGLSKYLQPSSGVPPKVTCEALSEVDQTLLLIALGETADAIYSHSQASGPTADGGVDPVLLSASEMVIGDAAAILEMDPTRDAGVESRRGRYPALALSGGSANGAFIAGFIFALLDLRERAIDSLSRQADSVDGGGEAARSVELIEQDERFGAVTGTSVGSLVATTVDLYFADTTLDRGRLKQDLESRREALLACAGSHSAAARRRPPQACALKTLVKDFTSLQEWDLLCAQDVGAGDLLNGCSNALMSFAPLEQRILTPFFRDFEPLLTGNDLIREAAATETRWAHSLALDERACGRADDASEAAGRVACLGDAVIASIVEVMEGTGKALLASEDIRKAYLGE